MRAAPLASSHGRRVAAVLVHVVDVHVLLAVHEDELLLLARHLRAQQVAREQAERRRVGVEPRLVRLRVSGQG